MDPEPRSTLCLRLLILGSTLAPSPVQFEVLEHVLRTGRANLIDTLAIEWHTSKRGVGGARLALQRRKESILRALGRANVRIIDWSGKAGAM